MKCKAVVPDMIKEGLQGKEVDISVKHTEGLWWEKKYAVCMHLYTYAHLTASTSFATSN